MKRPPLPTKPSSSAKSAELRRRAEAGLREFGKEREHHPMMTELHRRAEAGLRQRRKVQPAKARVLKSKAVAPRLLHELEVHQVELEMQNAELQETRNRLETMLEEYTDLYDFAPVGYFTLDASGAIQRANLTGASLMRIERSRLVNRPFGQLVSAELRPAFRAFLKKVFAGPTKQSLDVAILRAGQAALTVNIEAQCMLNGQECRVAVMDITVRKQAEELLRRNQAVFGGIIDQAPVGVHVVNARFQLQQVNSKGMPLFSAVHPLIGRDFSEIVHAIWPKPAADQVVARFRHTLKTGEPYQAPEFSERRRDTGEEEFYEWQIQRVILPAGEHGVVCFFNNITERKEAEAAQRRVEVLAASNKKLELEIVRRHAVEESLRKSEQHQIRLLAESHRMQEQLRLLSRQILSAQEEERKRISRELHDVIAQTLTGINVRLAALKKSAALDPRGLDQSIALTQRLVEKSVEIVHQFARELRPAVLDDLGLIPALHSYLQQFTATTGVRTYLTAFAGVEQLDMARRTVLFRVAQEALTNVARHAKASRVDVNIEKLPDCIRMKVQDDGKSFSVESTLHADGEKRLGLLGMRERVEMVGGNFGVESAPGRGTTIEAQIPLEKGRRISRL